MKYKKKNVFSLMLALVLVLSSMTVFASAAEPRAEEPSEMLADPTPMPMAMATPLPAALPPADDPYATAIPVSPSPVPVSWESVSRTEITLATDNTTSMDLLAQLARAFCEENPDYYVSVEYYVNNVPGWKSYDDLASDLAHSEGHDLLLLRNPLPLYGVSEDNLVDLLPWFSESEGDSGLGHLNGSPTLDETFLPGLYESLTQADTLLYLPVTLSESTAGGSEADFEPYKTISLTSACEHQDGAMDFIRFMLSTRAQSLMQSFGTEGVPVIAHSSLTENPAAEPAASLSPENADGYEREMAQATPAAALISEPEDVTGR